MSICVKKYEPTAVCEHFTWSHTKADDYTNIDHTRFWVHLHERDIVLYWTRQLGLQFLRDYRTLNGGCPVYPEIMHSYLLALDDLLIQLQILQLRVRMVYRSHTIINPSLLMSIEEKTHVKWSAPDRQTDRRWSVPSVPGRESDCVLRVQMCYWILRNSAPTFSHNTESTIWHGLRFQGTIILSRKLAYRPRPSLYSNWTGKPLLVCRFAQWKRFVPNVMEIGHRGCFMYSHRLKDKL